MSKNFLPSNLSKYRVFVEKKTPPEMLLEKANKIIHENPTPTDSMNHTLEAKQRAKLTKWKDTSKTRMYNEEDLRRHLVPQILSASWEMDYPTLKDNSSHLWHGCVPLPKDPAYSVVNLKKLPRPKIDVVFGYKEETFNARQLAAADMLQEGGNNYIRPDPDLLFPFFLCGQKSQAKGGTILQATNQLAVAGAIALNGLLQLKKRIPNREQLQLDDDAHCFSMAMDHERLNINIHWVEEDESNELEPPEFHLYRIKEFSLREIEDIKEAQRMVENIIVHFSKDTDESNKLNEPSNSKNSNDPKDSTKLSVYRLCLDTLYTEALQGKLPRSNRNLEKRRAKRTRIAEEDHEQPGEEEEENSPTAGENNKTGRQLINPSENKNMESPKQIGSPGPNQNSNGIKAEEPPKTSRQPFNHEQPTS